MTFVAALSLHCQDPLPTGDNQIIQRVSITANLTALVTEPSLVIVSRNRRLISREGHYSAPHCQKLPSDDEILFMSLDYLYE